MPALRPDVALVVRLHAECSRHRYTHDPGPVLDELRALAAGRSDLLAEAAGLWAGYRDGEPHTRVLADALLTLPGAEEWAEVGRQRRTTPVQSTFGGSPG